MPKICYVPKRFNARRQFLIGKANEILSEYASAGYDITVRQLYYQFVARDLIENTQKSYKRLGSCIDEARLAGLIDWSYIVDRTRNLKGIGSWDDPAEIVEGCYDSYHVDRWANQEYRVELWCFPPETPVITASGSTPIADVAVGERVMTHTGAWKSVSKRIEHKHNGPIVELNTTGLLPIRCTPNHKFRILPHDTSRPGYKGKDRKYGDPCWRRADKLTRYDLLMVPRPKITREIAFVTMRGGPRSKVVGNDGYVSLDSRLMRLVGHYLAEGCVMLDGRTTQFTFGASELPHAVFIERYAKALGLGTHTYVNESTCVIYVFGKALASWLENEFGSGAYSKRLPPWLMTLPIAMQLEAMHYHFLGDGTLNDPTRSAILVSTRSECLARQEQLLLLRAGYAATLHKVDDHGAPTYRVNVSGEAGAMLSSRWGIELSPRTRRFNHARMTNTHALFPVREVVEITKKYGGTVYNLEVNDDNSYCVPAAAHNCEKEALIGIFARVANKYNVDFFACRGYVSQSEMWRAARRLHSYSERGQIPVIIHFGDHDPSGIDMTRDIRERLQMFGLEMDVNRLALNMDQVTKYKPPHNPAKMTDSRYDGYVAKFGDKSWELDALPPDALAKLVSKAVNKFRDLDKWEERIALEQDARAKLKTLADNWPSIADNLESEHEDEIEDNRLALDHDGTYAAELK